MADYKYNKTVDADIQTNEGLKKLLSKERGLFGHVRTLGMRSTPYEYIGYELSTDFLPTLKQMSMEQKKNLVTIMIYFEIHAEPLKAILEDVQNQKSANSFTHELAWSHFMTVVMFGMLEVAVKISPFAVYSGKYIKKQESIKSFLENFLPQSTKDSVVKRYSISPVFKSTKSIQSFSDVIDHLWEEIRSEFIHDAGIQSKGMEWTTFGDGKGTEDDPIKLKSDVPMPEWLKIVWQAILNSYGYKGTLEHPKYQKN